MKRGDTTIFRATVRDADGVALNLTGKTIRFTAKYGIADADAAAVIAKTTPTGVVITDAAAGICEVRLVTTDTSTLTATYDLVWDLQVADGSSTQTVDSGVLRVEMDATRASP